MTTQQKNIDKAERQISGRELDGSELEKVVGGGKTTKGSGSGRPSFSELTITKVLDVATPG
jgi:type VI protein secretion system component Hcp